MHCCQLTSSSIDVKLRCSVVVLEERSRASRAEHCHRCARDEILICDYCLAASRHSDRHSVMHRSHLTKGCLLLFFFCFLSAENCANLSMQAQLTRNSLGPGVLSMSFRRRNCSRLKIQVSCSDFDPGQLRCYIERDTQFSMSWEVRTLVLLLLQGRIVKPFDVFVKAFFKHFCRNISSQVPVECELAHSLG